MSGFVLLTLLSSSSFRLLLQWKKHLDDGCKAANAKATSRYAHTHKRTHMHT